MSLPGENESVRVQCIELHIWSSLQLKSAALLRNWLSRESLPETLRIGSVPYRMQWTSNVVGIAKGGLNTVCIIGPWIIDSYHHCTQHCTCHCKLPHGSFPGVLNRWLVLHGARKPSSCRTTCYVTEKAAGRCSGLLEAEWKDTYMYSCRLGVQYSVPACPHCCWTHMFVGAPCHVTLSSLHSGARRYAMC